MFCKRLFKFSGSYSFTFALFLIVCFTLYLVRRFAESIRLAYIFYKINQ
jgi:hypothetical protein